MKIIQILWEHNTFIDEIFKNLENDKIDVSKFELDHICFRVWTLEEYFSYKNKLENISDLLTETTIWGRNISTFKLNNPIIYKNRNIYLIELPSPKKWSNYKSWYEHAEFVIDKSFEEFMQEYKNIKFNEKAINKEINPDIKIDYNWCSVKFHHNTLEYVIQFEQNNNN